MMREYFIRGQRKTVEEIDNVVAVKLTASARGQTAAAFGAEARNEDTGMDAETANAFAGARWLFVQPSATTRSALSGPAALPDTDVVGKLIKRPSGRFGVVTKRLNVQLQANLTQAAAEQALADHGLMPLNRLGFAPNLYEVDTTAHADALELRSTLNKDARFTLAEPSSRRARTTAVDSDRSAVSSINGSGPTRVRPEAPPAPTCAPRLPGTRRAARGSESP